MYVAARPVQPISFSLERCSETQDDTSKYRSAGPFAPPDDNAGSSWARTDKTRPSDFSYCPLPQGSVPPRPRSGKAGRSTAPWTPEYRASDFVSGNRAAPSAGKLPRILEFCRPGGSIARAGYRPGYVHPVGPYRFPGVVRGAGMILAGSRLPPVPVTPVPE
jgi:hypothetical protein